jgi:hypothetical protein
MVEHGSAHASAIAPTPESAAGAQGKLAYRRGHSIRNTLHVFGVMRMNTPALLHRE